MEKFQNSSSTKAKFCKYYQIFTREQILCDNLHPDDWELEKKKQLYWTEAVSVEIVYGYFHDPTDPWTVFLIFKNE